MSGPRVWKIAGMVEHLTGERGMRDPQMIVLEGPQLTDFKPLKSSAEFIQYTDPVEVGEIGGANELLRWLYDGLEHFNHDEDWSQREHLRKAIAEYFKW